MKSHYIQMFKHKKIIIFGTGRLAELVSKRLANPIEYYVDNDSTKWGTFFEQNKKIYSPSKINEENIEEIVVIVASMYYKEISEQLQKLGLENFKQIWDSHILFINLLDNPIEQSIRVETESIVEKFLALYQYGEESDLVNLLEDYEELVPLDERITVFKELLAYDKRTVDSIIQIIKNNFENYYLPVDIHYAYFLGRNYECEANYLDAIETYERILTYKTSPRIEQLLISKLERLHSEFDKEIKLQLIDRKNNELGYINQTCNLNIHIMPDNFYSQYFIEFINKNFNTSQHLFFIIKKANKLQYVHREHYSNIVVFDYYQWDLDIYQDEIIAYVHSSARLFIHFLDNAICRFLCRYRFPSTKLYWMIWGGDLYRYISISLYDQQTKKLLKQLGIQGNFAQKNESKLLHTFRNASIRKFDYILSITERNYQIVKEHFCTIAEYKRFIYPNPIEEIVEHDYSTDKIAINKNGRQSIILLGNSGDPTNNHLEILTKLSQYEEENFIVLVPLAYGHKKYIRKIIELGQQLLGKKFVPLTQFQDLQSYNKLLSKVDVAIMNHNRPQAIGTIRLLLNLKKKIYMKSNNTAYMYFVENGVSIYDIRELEDISFKDLINYSESIALRNLDRIGNLFSHSIALKLMNDILES